MNHRTALRRIGAIAPLKDGAHLRYAAVGDMSNAGFAEFDQLNRTARTVSAGWN